MRIPSFFKTPRHRQFTYQPLYYNPEKDERDHRNMEIMKELGVQETGKDYQPGIRRGSMKAYFKGNKRAVRNSNLRLVLIIIFLFFLAYVILVK